MLAEKGGAGRFASDEARVKFLAVYDKAFGLWPQPWDEFDVPTRTTTTHVHHYGPDTGEPVILLHAAGFSGAQWFPNVAALGREHPVFALDTPGDPNRSVARAPIASPEASANWLDEVLAGLDCGPAHLVGSSYGGWIALNQAVRAPGRVASISLLDPAGLQPPGARFWRYFWTRGLISLGPGFIRRPLAAWLGEPTLAQSQILALMWAGIRSYQMEPKQPDVLTEDELRAIDVPALLVTGQRSALIRPDEARAFARLMLRAQVRVLAGARHGPSIEATGETDALLLEFIAEAGRQEAGQQGVS